MAHGSYDVPRGRVRAALALAAVLVLSGCTDTSSSTRAEHQPRRVHRSAHAAVVDGPSPATRSATHSPTVSPTFSPSRPPGVPSVATASLVLLRYQLEMP